MADDVKCMDVHYDVLFPFVSGLNINFCLVQHTGKNEFILSVDGLDDLEHIKKKIRLGLDHVLCYDVLIIRNLGLLAPS